MGSTSIDPDGFEGGGGLDPWGANCRRFTG